MRESIGTNHRTRSRVHPICFVGASRKLQFQLLGITPRSHNIVVVSILQFAVVEIECILLARFANTPTVSSGRNATGYEILVQIHLYEVKAFKEIPQIAKPAQDLGVIGSFAPRILNRKLSVQV